MKPDKVKNIYRLLALGLMLFGLTPAVQAQTGGPTAGTGSTATGNGSADIVQRLGISKLVDMNFGNIAVADQAGAVILSPQGSRSVTGGITLPSTSGEVSAASFKVTGKDGFTFSITLPTDPYVLTVSGGVQTITVNNFTTPALTGTLVNGESIVPVGATLNVAANQAAGSYSNPNGFKVTVNYN